MNIKECKIKLITKKLEEVTGKKVVLTEGDKFVGIADTLLNDILKKLNKFSDKEKSKVLVRLKNSLEGWLSTNKQLTKPKTVKQKPYIDPHFDDHEGDWM